MVWLVRSLGKQLLGLASVKFLFDKQEIHKYFLLVKLKFKID